MQMCMQIRFQTCACQDGDPVRFAMAEYFMQVGCLKLFSCPLLFFYVQLFSIPAAVLYAWIHQLDRSRFVQGFDYFYRVRHDRSFFYFGAVATDFAALK